MTGGRTRGDGPRFGRISSGAPRMNSIFKKGLLLIAAPLLFQGIFLAVLLQNERESAAAESWALHSRLVIGQAEIAMRRLVEESNRVRGLVITGDPLFAARPARPPLAEVEDLRRLIRDNPVQQHRVVELGAIVTRLTAWIAGLEQLVHGGRVEEARERIRSLEGERILRAAQGETTAFLAEEQRLGRERLDR